MPDHLVAIAASDGKVWQADWSPKGFQVVIDHGSVVTYYAHLENLFVTPSERGKSNQRVVAGQPLGFIGASPLDAEHLKHLHFEIWLGGPTDKIDPEKLIYRWTVVDPLAPSSSSIPVA
jgi:murein DD-endopeptidase MepM/ murein hydrolase activator NlpD